MSLDSGILFARYRQRGQIQISSSDDGIGSDSFFASGSLTWHGMEWYTLAFLLLLNTYFASFLEWKRKRYSHAEVMIAYEVLGE